MGGETFLKGGITYSGDAKDLVNILENPTIPWLTVSVDPVRLLSNSYY